MTQMGVLEAKNGFSSLIRRLELGQDDRVVVTRNGRPVAQITRYESADPAQRVGVAKGHDLYHDGWDSPEIEDEIADAFGIAL